MIKKKHTTLPTGFVSLHFSFWSILIDMAGIFMGTLTFCLQTDQLLFPLTYDFFQLSFPFIRPCGFGSGVIRQQGSANCKIRKEPTSYSGQIHQSCSSVLRVHDQEERNSARTKRKCNIGATSSTAPK